MFLYCLIKTFVRLYSTFVDNSMSLIIIYFDFSKTFGSISKTIFYSMKLALYLKYFVFYCKKYRKLVSYSN